MEEIMSVMQKAEALLGRMLKIVPSSNEKLASNKADAAVTPKPPVGHGVHHYHFQLFALDKNLSVGDAPEKNDLLKAMQGHVLAQGELIGTYERVAQE
jgi:phosphatidylethanolamine-binding protein (PEBP) family uncharacterized protein